MSSIEDTNTIYEVLFLVKLRVPVTTLAYYRAILLTLHQAMVSAS